MSHRVFVEIPTWLGDAVMSTPAIENLVQSYGDIKLTLFGSFVSTRALQKHPNVEKVIVDESKKSGNRFFNLYKIAKSAGRFDLALSFRRQLSSRFLLFCLDAKKKAVYERVGKKKQHQVQHYVDFVNRVLGTDAQAKSLQLYYPKYHYDKPTLGINPGATYGSAKRWYPQRFAQVAKAFSSSYDIVIFGAPKEVAMAQDVAKELDSLGVKNYTDLSGKTDIAQLIEHIGGLSLFITNDSGPMHIAAAYKVPTAAIFGPTKHDETSQWQNPKSAIVRKELECVPCMKRVCPLGTHECMRNIEAKEVIEKVSEVLK